MSAVDIGLYVLLAVAGFAAGVVNSIAGGGSFLTLPALMLFGLDPKLANGTNRLAVLFSSASAVATFQKHGHFDKECPMLNLVSSNEAHYFKGHSSMRFCFFLVF